MQQLTGFFFIFNTFLNLFQIGHCLIFFSKLIFLDVPIRMTRQNHVAATQQSGHVAVSRGTGQWRVTFWRVVNHGAALPRHPAWRSKAWLNRCVVGSLPLSAFVRLELSLLEAAALMPPDSPEPAAALPSLAASLTTFPPSSFSASVKVTIPLSVLWTVDSRIWIGS